MFVVCDVENNAIPLALRMQWAVSCLCRRASCDMRRCALRSKWTVHQELESIVDIGFPRFSGVPSSIDNSLTGLGGYVAVSGYRWCARAS